MNSNLKKFFFLEPYIYVEETHKGLFFYNTLTGSFIENNNSFIIEFFNKFNKNIKSIILEFDDEHMEKEVKPFLDILRDNFMGDFVSSSSNPIQVSPFLKIEQMFDVNEEVANYIDNILELTININSYKYTDTPYTDAYKQFVYSFYYKQNVFLPFKYIKKVIDECKKGSIHSINIVGGNIFDYPELPSLVEYLNSLEQCKYYYFNIYDEISTSFLKLFKSNSEIILMLPVSCYDEYCSENINRFLNCGLPTTVNFIVEDYTHFDIMSNILSKHNIKSHKTLPFYNKKNYIFFKEYVFLNKNDIFQQVFSYKDIFRNKTINTHYFGKLLIRSDGKIFANPNQANVGTVNESIVSVVKEALNCDKSWRLLRQNVSPCSNCLYKCFCPPISNYEQVLEKNNLCAINT